MLPFLETREFIETSTTHFYSSPRHFIIIFFHTKFFLLCCSRLEFGEALPKRNIVVHAAFGATRPIGLLKRGNSSGSSVLVHLPQPNNSAIAFSHHHAWRYEPTSTIKGGETDERNCTFIVVVSGYSRIVTTDESLLLPEVTAEKQEQHLGIARGKFKHGPSKVHVKSAGSTNDRQKCLVSMDIADASKLL